MRVATVTTTLLATLIATTALAGQLSPGLESYLAEKHEGGALKALLVLEDQVDVLAIDLDLHTTRAPLATRHAHVVTALQDKARATQTDLLADLEQRLGKGVAGYKAYWLINAVLVTGSEDAIRSLAARADVAVAEVDLVPQLIGPVGAAPMADKARGIGITPGLVAVGARRVWDELQIRGEGTLIGSFDTGVDGDHPALSARWRGNHAPHDECWLDVLDNGSTTPIDDDGHGTHTTGTMTGLAVDDTIGVAPASEWIAVNAIGQTVNEDFDNDVLDCFQFFTDPDGDPGTLDDVPDVVQNSWGVNENFAGYVDCDSRWWDAIDACEAAGVMLCWSAGNEGPSWGSVRSPADRATTLYNCFCVGATEHTEPFTIADFSSRGPAGRNCGPAENRTKPEISAPGVYIYSATPGGSYRYLDGTSMAGPHVAGVVALMRAADPDLDVITIKHVLMATAQDLGDPGEDEIYGHGFLNAFAAVKAALGPTGWVDGTVVDDVSGMPIAGAMVTVAGGPQHDLTAADGSYRLTLPIGLATISVAAFGYMDAGNNVAVAEDVSSSWDVRLDPLATATINGTVFEAGSYPTAGVPAPGVTVSVADTPLDPVVTDADGEFTLVLPAGFDYVVHAVLLGEGALSQVVPIADDGDLELYLGLSHTDGFESGDLGGLDWQPGGDVGWFVQTETIHEGAYAARSGMIGDYESSVLEVAVDCGVGGEASFWYKVSSEETLDLLRFYVDDGLREAKSGEVDWTRFATQVDPGLHTFRWQYDKSWTGSAGDDAAWLDSVVLPGGAPLVPVAVPMPWTIALTLEVDELATVPLVVMNQGAAALAVEATVTGWASIADGAVVVPPYDYHAYAVDIDATGLAVGYHTTNVVLASDDPVNPVLHVQLQLTVTDGTTAIDDLPDVFALLGAVPNPFNPQTTVRYTLPVAGTVSLQLFDVRGHLVRTLADGVRPAGPNEVRWDGCNHDGQAVASGTYFVRLTAGELQQVKSLLLVR